MKLWAKFWWFQFRAAIAAVIGWFLLAPLSFFREWEVIPAFSINGERLKHFDIAVWKWHWVDNIWGNAEDGVLGDNFYVARFPNAPRWRAYLWTAWRNSANNMRWKNSVTGGPFVRVDWHGWRFQAGYRPDNGWPVLRLLKMPKE